MRPRLSFQRRARDERGAEIVEFAFGSTMLFLLLFGIVQGGYTIWRYNMVATLAQEGARYASVRGLHSSATMSANGTAAAIQTYVQGRAFGAAPTVSVSAAPNTLSQGQTITVTVSQPITSLTNYVSWSGTMSASASMPMLR